MVDKNIEKGGIKMTARKNGQLPELLTFTWGEDLIRTILSLDADVKILPNGKPVGPMEVTISRNFGELLVMRELLDYQRGLRDHLSWIKPEKM